MTVSLKRDSYLKIKIEKKKTFVSVWLMSLTCFLIKFLYREN